MRVHVNESEQGQWTSSDEKEGSHVRGNATIKLAGAERRQSEVNSRQLNR